MSFLFQSRAAVLQAEAQQALVEKMIELEQVKLKALELEMDVKHMKIMADERHALKEHNQRLREALEPFVTTNSSEEFVQLSVRSSDIDAARAALKGDV
jgi:cell shape-determining protein MreC